jgi:hypothetical protein
MFEKFFKQKDAKYVFPTRAEVFGKLDDSRFEQFKTHVGMKKGEWNRLKKGEVVERLHTITFYGCCAHILPKPEGYPDSGISFWTKLLKRDEKTTETV